MLLSARALIIDESTEKFRSVIQDLISSLPTFQPTILEELRGTTNASLLQVQSDRWKLCDQLAPAYEKYFEDAVSILSKEENDQNKAEVIHFSIAKLERQEQYI